MNIFIDANIYLQFYKFEPSLLKKIEKLISLHKSGKITLWVSPLVQDEVARKRDGVINDTIKHFMSSNISSVSSHDLSDNLKKDIKDMQKESGKLKRKVQKEIKKKLYEKSFSADKLIEKIFKLSEISSLNDDLIKKASLRIKIGNPPKNLDSFHWEYLLENVPTNQDLFLISGDCDFASDFDKDKIGTFLYDEWKNEKKAEVYLYKEIGNFIKEKIPQIQDADRIIEEEDKIKTFNELYFSNFIKMIEVMRSKEQYLSDISVLAAANKINIPDFSAFRKRLEFINTINKKIPSGLALLNKYSDIIPNKK